MPWAPIKALAHLAADEGLRKWTQEVWLDFAGPHVIVWATNGAQLGAYLTEEPSIDHKAVSIPKHTIKAVKGFGPTVTLCVEEGRCSVQSLGTVHYWQDAGYATIEWRRVLPKQVTGIAQQFDATLLAAFLKVRKALGKKDAPSVRISHNGGEHKGPAGALVTLLDVPEFVGVLMPIPLDAKGSVFKAEAPEWGFQRGRAPAEPVDEPADAADLV